MSLHVLCAGIMLDPRVNKASSNILKSIGISQYSRSISVLHSLALGSQRRQQVEPPG